MPFEFETTVKQEIAHLSAVYPTPEDIPKCTSLLDDFLRCNVLGSQVRSIYRYGSRATCGYKFEEFKFCMTLKSLSMEERRTEWIKRRAEWWARRRLNKSSEDVWEIRSEPPQNYPPPATPGMFEEIQTAVNKYPP